MQNPIDEYSRLVNQLAALEEEQKEHKKVHEFIEKMDPNRRVWR